MHLFASTDYDGVVRLWDTRTLNVPLKTLKNVHEGKGLCLDWALSRGSGANIFCGGSDCCVKAIPVDGVLDTNSVLNTDVDMNVE